MFLSNITTQDPNLKVETIDYGRPTVSGQMYYDHTNDRVCVVNTNDLTNGFYGQAVVSNTSLVTGTVSMTSDTQEVLIWAKRKMAEEERINSIIAQYPELRKAKDVYELLLKLYT